MAISYKVEIKNLKELQDRFKQAPEITAKRILDAGNKSLMSLQGSAKQLAPVDTSRLRQSILVSPMKRTGSAFTGSVGTSTRYAAWLEEGTGIYGPKKTPIRPKTKKFLAFKTKDGKWIRSKGVKGVKGRFYMKGSVEQNQRKIDGFFEEAATNITKDLATK